MAHFLSLLQAVTIDTGITLSPTFFAGIIGGFMAFASLRSTVGAVLKEVADFKQDMGVVKRDVGTVMVDLAEMRGELRASRRGSDEPG